MTTSSTKTPARWRSISRSSSLEKGSSRSSSLTPRRALMTDSASVIISGIPVADEVNFAKIREMGIKPDEIDWPPPYKDSARMSCQSCTCDLWVGPETYGMYLNLTARGQEPLV